MDKNIEKLNDEMMDQVAGGMELRGYYHHQCQVCFESWTDTNREAVTCRACGEPNVSSWACR